MMKPCFHLNGTSKESLARGYETIRNHLNDAFIALREAAPNGRDYYPFGPEAMETATREHQDRFKRIDALIEELNGLIVHCDGD